jgi:hypothetical protein
MIGIGLVVESAVGQRTAKPFVEEEEQQCDLNSFGGEPVGIATALTFQQSMALQLAQIVAELVQSLGLWGKLKSGQHGLVELFGRGAAHGMAAVE